MILAALNLPATAVRLEPCLDARSHFTNDLLQSSYLGAQMGHLHPRGAPDQLSLMILPMSWSSHFHAAATREVL